MTYDAEALVPYRVYKNLPPPRSRKKAMPPGFKRTKFVAILETLEVGHAFLCPASRDTSNAHTRARTWAMYHGKNWEFRTAKTIAGVLIWRIA